MITYSGRFNHDLEWWGRRGRRPAVWWEWCNQQIFARARFDFEKSPPFSNWFSWKVPPEAQYWFGELRSIHSNKQQIMEMMVQQSNPLVLHQRRRLLHTSLLSEAISLVNMSFADREGVMRKVCNFYFSIFVVYINWLNKARKQNRFFDKIFFRCFVRFCSSVWGAPFVSGRVLFSHLIALLSWMTKPEGVVFTINSPETPSRV